MRAIDHLRDRLRRDVVVVRMGFTAGMRVWWIDHPYEEFDDATMRAAAVGHNGAPLLVESGDCLFGWEGNSQTWRSAYGE